jgi:hypothetical protein
MTTNLIDLRHARNATADHLGELQAYLTQLIGEPFRFARVSYGDELTLHFGDLRPAHSPKLKGKKYGAYILGVRGSPWIVKSGTEPLVLASGISLDELPSGLGKPTRKEEFEANPHIVPESRVLSGEPFVVRPVSAFGLYLRTSDGSALLILPTGSEDESDAQTIPEVALADWELISPDGLLSAGPGLNWSFQPSPAPKPS